MGVNVTNRFFIEQAQIYYFPTFYNGTRQDNVLFGAGAGFRLK